jgi:hypothetical protein
MRWLKGHDVHEYSATDDDALWLARAVAHEGSPMDAVAWALVQRFALLYPTYPTVAALVKAYAQPINPRWFPHGDLHAKRLRQLASDPRRQADELARARRREQYAQTPWDSIPAAARTAALEALEAHGDSPVPGAVHYRGSTAPEGATKKQAYARAQQYAANRPDLVSVVRIPQGYGRGQNWFFMSPSSQTLRLLPEDEPPLIVPPKPNPVGHPPPPDGAPQGEGWGWAWCWLESHSTLSASQEAESEPPSQPSEPQPDEQSGDEAEQCEPSSETNAPKRETATPENEQTDHEPALAEGPVMSIERARELGLFPEA